MDAQYAPPAFRETIDLAQKRTLALMEEFPETHICVAPHSLHAASREMIRAAAEFAAQHDCMMHVHVAEAEYEGALDAGTLRDHADFAAGYSERVERAHRCDPRHLHRRGREALDRANRRARGAQSDDQPIFRRWHLRCNGTARIGRNDGAGHRRRRQAVAARRDASRIAASKNRALGRQRARRGCRLRDGHAPWRTDAARGCRRAARGRVRRLHRLGLRRRRPVGAADQPRRLPGGKRPRSRNVRCRTTRAFARRSRTTRRGRCARSASAAGFVFTRRRS